MSAAFTPGPWTRQDDHGRRWIETAAGNDDAICEVLRRDPKVSRDRDTEFNANARLIEAAPELLAAVRGLLDALPSATTHPAIKRARAAIAKAQGASQ